MGTEKTVLNDLSMIQKVITKHLFICFLGTMSINGFCQKTIQPNHLNQDTIVTFYTWGIPEKFWNGDSCDSIIERQMGFKQESKGSCITPPDFKELEKHNKESEKIMRRRFGNKWRDKFEDEVRKCQGK